MAGLSTGKLMQLSFRRPGGRPRKIAMISKLRCEIEVCVALSAKRTLRLTVCRFRIRRNPDFVRNMRNERGPDRYKHHTSIRLLLHRQQTACQRSVYESGVSHTRVAGSPTLSIIESSQKRCRMNSGNCVIERVSLFRFGDHITKVYGLQLRSRSGLPIED